MRLGPVRLRAFGAAIFLLQAVAAAAQAEPIPPQTLAVEQRSCVASCTQQGVPLATCTPYCDCFAKGLGKRFTVAEYAAVSAAAKANQAPPKDVVTRMASIANDCRAGLQ
jgi:hypothetical protein